MKHSILALPALLRSSFIFATASQTTFSVQDDLLAFPQYEVKFSEDYITESQAQSRLRNNDDLPQDEAAPPAEIEHYRPAGSQANNNGKEEDAPQLDYEYMTLDNQPYLCSIPQVTKPAQTGSGGANDTLTKAEEERELARATERGWELLSGMRGNCVYFISGWWSYKFCYNDGVRQFHQLPPSRGVPVYPPVEDPGVEGYTLGMYSKDEKERDVQTGTDVAKPARKTSTPGSGELVQRGESRYLVQRLDGGTKCDLTGKDRRVEVQFHCNQHPSDRISLIKETSTCTYLLVIQTPRLCNDVAFQPPQKDAPNTISCSPILGEDQIEDYKHDLAALRESRIWETQPEAAKVFLGSNTPSTDPYPMVGDIPLGAHRTVPLATKLEKSAIVGGGKETYIDTVASSQGKILSKEDIEKLGLGDAKAVETLRKKLEEIAQGQEWKLDVIDTPRGREYRGIIGDEEEEEGKKEKGDGEVGPGDEQGEDGGGGKGSQEEYFREEL
ncbi:Protein OS-9 [Vermiconidia calcicola]|uniref:Protein OS-9 n=1 Tax=Vermiconidia calcicola TaxID=1690605 RepID=A0ACC3NDD2_9PEZI|nr:Protein OS-9 [Vermiconidia calcicola]